MPGQDKTVMDRRLAAQVLSAVVGRRVTVAKVQEVGRGTHGTVFRAEPEDGSEPLYLKVISSTSELGHDYPADRMATLLHTYAGAKTTGTPLPLGVVALQDGDAPVVLRGIREAVLVSRGLPAQPTLEERLKSVGPHLDADGRRYLDALVRFMWKTHSCAPPQESWPRLHRRKLRETLHHGETLLGLLDMFADAHGGMTLADQHAYAAAALDSRYRLLQLPPYITAVHGDLHWGNILTLENGAVLPIDPGRGQFGHPGEDLAMVTTNLLLASMVVNGRLTGGYREAVRRLLLGYADLAGSDRAFDTLGFYYGCWSPAAVSPRFHPEYTPHHRRELLRFGLRCLEARRVTLDWIEDTLGGP